MKSDADLKSFGLYLF